MILPAENKNYDNDIILRLSPNRKTAIVEEHKPGHIVAYKEVSVIDLYYALIGSFRSPNILTCGLLPNHCLSVSMGNAEKYLFLWNPELRADMTYNGVEYPDFPIPRLVFGVRILDSGKVADSFIGVVEDEEPTMDTIMYHYPFSNLYPKEGGRVCTGNNVMPRYRDLRKLSQFPRYLLGLPDNDDFYDSKHNRLELGHRELMEHLKDKDPSYYYSDILVPNGRTLFQFIGGR